MPTLGIELLTQAHIAWTGAQARTYSTGVSTGLRAHGEMHVYDGMKAGLDWAAWSC